MLIYKMFIGPADQCLLILCLCTVMHFMCLRLYAHAPFTINVHEL